MEREPYSDTPVSRCRFYRRECDLPANVDPPELGRIVMQAGHVWALTMPAELGQKAKAHMESRGSAIGPIVLHPRSNRWTFLIRADLPEDDRLFAELFRNNVQVARTGATIALPSPTAESGGVRQWIEPPRNTFRPSGQVVVAAIRAWVEPSGCRTMVEVRHG